VTNWEVWLADVSNRTLPGGVAVGALAAAMGAALAAKAIRVTLARGRLSPDERQAFEAAAGAMREGQVALLGLVEADQEAFRRVLSVGKGPVGVGKGPVGAGKGPVAGDERRDAWLAATDVPIRVAETCRDLLGQLSSLHESCLPVVLVDVEIGTHLLLAGLDTGVRAARANLQDWGLDLLPDPVSGTLVRRLQALEQDNG